MDHFCTALREFLGILHEGPPPPDVPTARVLRALRSHLDAVLPHWRSLAAGDAAGETTGVMVEVPLPGGRVLHGALYQRPSQISEDGV